MKKIKRTFNLILIFTAMLTMAQTAWAQNDKTKTFEISSVTGSSNPLTYDGHNFLCVTGSEMISKYSGMYQFDSQFQEEGTIRLYPRISGKVKKVEFTSAKISFMINGSGYLKIGKNDTWSNTYTEDINSFTSIIFEYASGIQLDNEEDYLEIKSNADMMCSFYINAASSSKLIITYEPTTSTAIHSHDFTFNVVGNTLTATCGHSDGLVCSLADANYNATLTLSPSVDTYYRPNSTYSATLNLAAFNTLTGLNATATDITYVNSISGDNLGSATPTTAGHYTASVTVTVGGTDYTLTTDFVVNTENNIYNNIRQISVSKTTAKNDEVITITFTPRLHELVNTLTVTGATTNMSIGNGITKVDEYTYTFKMPFEEVTVGATFKSPDASQYKYTISTDIAGSGAVDYNAKEYLGAGDAITITFMPYLQGNLEAGSVVLEGLTVTGATTSMSVGSGITDNGDNTYTFTMPGENVTVTAKAYLSADAILAGTINEPIYIKQGNGIQIGCNNIWTYVNDGALPLVIPDGNTLRLAGGTDVRLDLADKNAIACEGDAIVELIPNEVSNEIWIGDRPERNSGKATIKVGPAGKTLTIRVADESTETVHLTVKSISQYDRNCDVIGCDEGGSCGSIVVESGQVESREYFNHSGRAFRTTDGTITFGYKYPDDKIIFDGGSEGTVKIEDGKQFHSYTDNNTKYSGTINLQGINSFYARPDKYTVNYCEHDGQNQKVRYVAHGMPFSFKAATPADEGHEFQGWKNMVTDEVYEHDFIVTNDLNIIAQWTKLLTNADITVAEIPDQTYNGSAIEPEVVVTDGETPLVLDTDYEVTYTDNTNAGTSAKVTITGKGKYSGTVEKPFTIVPKVTELGALTLIEDQNGITAEINGSYTDNETFSLAEDISVKSITFDRTFQQGVTSTIILPFAIESGKYSGGTFYEFQSVDYEDNKWVASMTKVSGDIEAQKPYLFVPSSDKLTIDGDVTLKAYSGAECADTKGDWTFKGVFNVKFWSKGVKTDYFFASTAATSTNGQSVNAGDFVRIGNNCGLNPFRCYLSYSGSESSLSKSEQQLPSNIEVRLIDNVASVVETDENPSDDRGDITTPVSEIIPNSGTKVWSFDKMIFIESESGFGYQIVDLSGRILKTGVTNSTREEISLGRTVGIVIVKIGGKTFKVNY